jgi:hypothetical protein
MQVNNIHLENFHPKELYKQQEHKVRYHLL